MSVIDVVRLLRFALGCWVLIFTDACAELLGHGMPFRHRRFDTPHRLNTELMTSAVAPLAAAPQITAVRDTGVPSVSSNCENRIVAIEQQGDPVLPDTLFIKLPMPSLLTRWFFALIGSWELESYFCRHIAPHVPLRTPRTFATRHAGTRFYIIQENLRDDPQVRLFTNWDMQQGPDIALVQRCLDAFARLHACHYDLDRREQLAILPLDNHPFIGPRRQLVSRALNTVSLTPCQKRLPGLISEPLASAYRRTLAHWDLVLAEWFGGQLSLLHGDSHLGNFFISGDEMGMLDFQAVHWGKGIRDVVYFLSNSLPGEQLAESERELVRYYVARRAAYGTAIDFEQTWQDYRGLSFHPLMTLVVSVGLGALNEEQIEVNTEVLRRAVATAERVDYAGWLDNLLQRS